MEEKSKSNTIEDLIRNIYEDLDLRYDPNANHVLLESIAVLNPVAAESYVGKKIEIPEKEYQSLRSLVATEQVFNQIDYIDKMNSLLDQSNGTLIIEISTPLALKWGKQVERISRENYFAQSPVEGYIKDILKLGIDEVGKSVSVEKYQAHLRIIKESIDNTLRTINAIEGSTGLIKELAQKKKAQTGNAKQELELAIFQLSGCRLSTLAQFAEYKLERINELKHRDSFLAEAYQKHIYKFFTFKQMDKGLDQKKTNIWNYIRQDNILYSAILDVFVPREEKVKVIVQPHNQIEPIKRNPLIDLKNSIMGNYSNDAKQRVRYFLEDCSEMDEGLIKGLTESIKTSHLPKFLEKVYKTSPEKADLVTRTIMDDIYLSVKKGLIPTASDIHRVYDSVLQQFNVSVKK